MNLKQDITEIMQKKPEDQLWHLMRLLQRFNDFLEAKLETEKQGIQSAFDKELEARTAAFQKELDRLTEQNHNLCNCTARRVSYCSRLHLLTC